LAANHTSRRELEKNVAAVDTRLARFEDHRAAVKTNQEYTALLHEIATAKAEKDAIEEQILLTMEAADGISAEIKAAETALAQTRLDVDAHRGELAEERRSLEAELTRLTAERTSAAKSLDAPVLAKYEQLLKQRRMLAVTEMVGELCTACHVRLRPAVAQTVRRNSEIVYCDSCQRILYFRPVATDAAGQAASA
jgi:predicted  nucleic acid-binding Zn-ribbon protein